MQTHHAPNPCASANALRCHAGCFRPPLCPYHARPRELSPCFRLDPPGAPPAVGSGAFARAVRASLSLGSSPFPMLRLLTLALLGLLTSCGRPEIVNKATADFLARYPSWKFVKAYMGESDAEHARVHIRYEDTPASVFPSQRSIFEFDMGYRRADGKWVLAEERGSRYIGPAR